MWGEVWGSVWWYREKCGEIKRNVGEVCCVAGGSEKKCGEVW